MARAGQGSGTRIHAKGYVQIVRRGPWRGWLEHRKVMYEACQEFCYYPLNDNLPPGMTVEHLDHNRCHNCRANLMLLDKRIHDYISGEHWRNFVKPAMESRVEMDMPEWVTEE